MGAAARWRGGGLTKNTEIIRGPEFGPLPTDLPPTNDREAAWRTTPLVWEGIYGHPLTDADLAAIEGNLFRFIDLLACINGSLLGAHHLSTSDGDEAA